MPCLITMQRLLIWDREMNIAYLPHFFRVSFRRSCKERIKVAFHNFCLKNAIATHLSYSLVQWSQLYFRLSIS